MPIQGWRTEPGGDRKPLFSGRPDIDHALRARLIALLATTGSITRGLATAGPREI